MRINTNRSTDVARILAARLSADRDMMNMKRFKRYRPDWDWKGIIGSAACIKWSFRDLENLDAALGLFSARRRAVQAGGNIGIFAKRLAEEFQEVVTFEPDAGLFKAMSINAPERNIVRHQMALGDMSCGVSLSAERRDSSGRPSHEGLTHVTGDGNIPMRTLDSFQYAYCSLLYLDIEGYELKALRGASETIDRCRPVVGLEVNGSSEYYGDSDEALRTFMREKRYVLKFTRNSDEIYLPEEFTL